MKIFFFCQPQKPTKSLGFYVFFKDFSYTHAPFTLLTIISRASSHRKSEKSYESASESFFKSQYKSLDSYYKMKRKFMNI